MEHKKGVSGSTLKIIAIVTMFIDHIGATILFRMIQSYATTGITLGEWSYQELVQVYMAMRYIGRIAFPIYCFLLVEGMEKTRNRGKYALRLGMFALASEIPFDLAFSNKVLEFGYQNVFFTLFIGLVTMIVVEKIEQGLKEATALLRYVTEILIVIPGALLAEFLCTDYGAIGVICIMVLYLFRKNKISQIVAGCGAFLWETTAPLAFIPIAFYNGKRGLKLKYVFYLFYPVHLFLLYLTCLLLGLK